MFWFVRRVRDKDVSEWHPQMMDVRSVWRDPWKVYTEGNSNVIYGVGTHLCQKSGLYLRERRFEREKILSKPVTGLKTSTIVWWNMTSIRKHEEWKGRVKIEELPPPYSIFIIIVGVVECIFCDRNRLLTQVKSTTVLFPPPLVTIFFLCNRK